MRFVTLSQAAEYIRDKTVAVVGSGPSSLDNEPGFVDSYEVVVRVNNHKVGERQGHRTDVHYSFYGTSIRKTAEELKREGVRLCMCKLPNSRPIESEWHIKRGKLVGIDYRYIYTNRVSFWFCPTYIPEDESFLRKFHLLQEHQPTTGFSAILDVLACAPKSCYLTGFDFFSSGIHNVDEAWRPGDPTDPICHRPDLEAAWLKHNLPSFPLTLDKRLQELLA
jgi:hypothetical protein